MAEKEYIEREALLDRVYAVRDKLQLDLNNPFEDGVRIGFENVEIEIENYPAADVRPVVRAKWIYTNMSRLVCSNCGNPVAFSLKVCANADNEYCFACDNGNQFKPMTNADRIRSMTDEELAEWIERIRVLCANEFCGKACPLHDACFSFAEQPTEMLDWLKQEGE